MLSGNIRDILLFAVVFLAVTQTAGAVQLIGPNDPKMCEVVSSCQYIKDEYCYRNRDGKEYCDEHISRDIGRFGANTFVYQSAEWIEEPSTDEWGPTKYFLAYGQAYYCPPEGSDKKLTQHRRIKKVHRVQFYTAENQARCESVDKCALIRADRCSTGREKGRYRCMRKFAKKLHRAAGNRVVLTEEVARDFGYKQTVNIYSCPSAGND